MMDKKTKNLIIILFLVILATFGLFMRYLKTRERYIEVHQPLAVKVSEENKEKNRSDLVEEYENIWEEKRLKKEKSQINVSGIWEVELPEGEKEKAIFQQKGDEVTGIFSRPGMYIELKFSGDMSGNDLVGVLKNPSGKIIRKVIILVEKKKLSGITFSSEPLDIISWEAVKKTGDSN